MPPGLETADGAAEVSVLAAALAAVDVAALADVVAAALGAVDAVVVDAATLAAVVAAADVPVPAPSLAGEPQAIMIGTNRVIKSNSRIRLDFMIRSSSSCLHDCEPLWTATKTNLLTQFHTT
jgi:hypothetical protein